MDGAVAKEALDPTGVAGPRRRVRARSDLVVAAQHLGGLAVAGGAGIGGAGARPWLVENQVTDDKRLPSGFVSLFDLFASPSAALAA